MTHQPQYLLAFHSFVRVCAPLFRPLLFVVLAAGLWCFTAGCHVNSPLFRSTIGESIRPSSFHNPTLSTDKHVKFATLRYRLPPIALQTVQVSVEPPLSTATHNAETEYERSLSHAVVPQWPSPLPRFQQRCLCTSRKDAFEISPLSNLFSKAEPLPFEMKININLVCQFFLLEACQRNATG